MDTIESRAGEHIREACARALAAAQESGEDVRFSFNGHEITVHPSNSIGDLYAEWEKLTGHPVLSAEAEAAAASKRLKDQEREWAEKIAAAGAMTEQQLRDAEAPWPKTLDELNAYIKTLTDRPHDYGTCVYAMSLAAVAAYHYVAGKVGATGFQAGCADMDILRRTRGIKGGFRLLDYDNLLYPQYCNAEHFPSYTDLLADPKISERIAEQAKQKLASSESAHPAVKAHWERLANAFGRSEA